MAGGPAVLLALLAGAQQTGPKKDPKVLQELWQVRALRTTTGTSRYLIITAGDPEELPDRAVVRVDPYVPVVPRRSPGDLPAEAERLLGEAPPMGSSFGKPLLLERGRWRFDSTSLEDPILPLIHVVEFSFDPRDGQVPEVAPLVARAQPIRRRTLFFPTDAKFDPAAQAEQVRKLAAALSEIKAFLDPIVVPADALADGITDRMSIAQMPADYAQREEKRGLIAKADVTRIAETLSKFATPHFLSQTRTPLYQTAIALGFAGTQGTSAGTALASNPPAYSFLYRSVYGRSAQHVSLARQRFGVELYLYERTVLADLTDQTWVAFRRHGAGDTDIWEEWKKAFALLLETLKLCNDAMVTLEDEELKASYVALTGGVRIIPPPPDPKKPKEEPKKPEDPKGLPFLKVAEFHAACDARIGGDKKVEPDKLRADLIQLLPAERKFK